MSASDQNYHMSFLSNEFLKIFEYLWSNKEPADEKLLLNLFRSHFDYIKYFFKFSFRLLFVRTIFQDSISTAAFRDNKTN